MHQALFIDEIVRDVIQHSSGHGSGTLVALALSCRTWKDPALDRIWMQLDSLEHLLNTIPGVQRVNGTYALKQSAISPSLDRFNLYARRVKRISHRRHIKADPAVFAIFTAGAVEPVPCHVLLPFLRSVTLSSFTFGFIQSCSSMSEGLNDLEVDLGFTPAKSVSSQEHLHAYLQQLVNVAPNLSRLSVRGSTTRPILGAILKIQNLRSLALRLGATLTMDALLAIRTYPRLSELELQMGHINPNDLLAAFRNTDGRTLLSLKKLRLRANTPSLALMLDIISPNSLNILHLEAEEHLGTPVYWVPVFNSIRHKAVHTLQTLIIEHHVEIDDAVTDNAHISGVINGGSKMNIPIAFNDLRILTAMRHLRKFVLDTTLPLSICDEQLASLVKCWPNLEHFELGSIAVPSINNYYGIPQLTDLSLKEIAGMMPKLASLVIPIDLTKSRMDVEEKNPMPQQHNLTRLTLACANIPDPKQLAYYLHRVFPSLLNVDGLLENDEAWTQVRDILRDISLRLSSAPI